MCKSLLLICLVFTVFQSFLADVAQVGGGKKHENDVSQHGSVSVAPGVVSQEKPKRLFARTRYLSQRRQMARPAPEAPVPARRCAGLMESCSAHTPCCDPCGSCHCRLFNTICHCWRLNQLCTKAT